MFLFFLIQRHPYLFFNSDGNTFTFFGICVSLNGQLIDPNTNQIFQMFDHLIMDRNLMLAIKNQCLDEDKSILSENIATMNKSNKIRKLVRLMRVHGIDKSDEVFDPDPSYELTMDNSLKMIAIYMRFIANLPVIIMVYSI